MQRLPKRQTEKLANILGQRIVGRAGENLPLVVLARPYRLGCGFRIDLRLLRDGTCAIARRHRRRNYAGLRCCIHRVKYPRLTWLSYTLGLETAALRGSLFASAVCHPERRWRFATGVEGPLSSSVNSMPSLRDSRHLFLAYPALKRWAIFFLSHFAGLDHHEARRYLLTTA